MGLHILDDLRARELLVDVSSEAELYRHLQEPRTVYVGFDPTAESLHVGSLVPLLALRRFQLAGHAPIVLVGGGTGLIGDPSGKAGERALNPKEVVAAWAERLERQVARFLEFGSHPAAARIVNNYEWLGELDAITFLREVGKHFPLGSMLAKESVRSRLGREGGGMSFTEFSYMLLQAYDFLCLARRYGCTVQAGGSDQWGNITAGIDLARRVDRRTVYGLTFPLVTNADGTKFGKTEAGTVWLDPAKTSPYAMYQFWINTADADVVRYLRYFTFLPLEEIGELAVTVQEAPERREAQRVLATEVTRLVHGEEGLREAERVTQALFCQDFRRLSERELVAALEGAPRTDVPVAELEQLSLVDLLARSGLARSKRHGRELVASGAVRVNGARAAEGDAACSRDWLLHGRYLVLTRGKKTHHLVVAA